jgi:ankyrin repeat protein
MAVRYNEAECLKLLISYDCNIYLKMRNGDTALHVAAAYNSLECMILLTNFGGMELYTQKNRYDLKAIEIAKKMRNYECFEVLQKLERNV